jgi:hypothetical protein
MRQLLAFYRGKCADSKGRFIEEIWQWDFERLETTHDYIQWLFPLAEKSGFNPGAPALDHQTVEIIRNSAEIQGRLLISLRVMLAFLGLEMRGDEIHKAREYTERRQNWLKPSNHNHLRLTRILKCLAILGLESHATALFQCLSAIYEEEPDNITEATLLRWQAASQPAQLENVRDL